MCVAIWVCGNKGCGNKGVAIRGVAIRGVAVWVWQYGCGNMGVAIRGVVIWWLYLTVRVSCPSDVELGRMR